MANNTAQQQVNQAVQTASKNVLTTAANKINQAMSQPSAQTQQAAKTTQEALGGVYQVQANGQAPKGLKSGDQVVTGGGTYTIKSVNQDGTYQSQLTNKDQTTGNYKGQYASAPAAPGNVYRVGADGKAPKGLKAGSQVVTGGGTYQITAVNPDGTYQSQLINKNQTTANYTGAYANAPAAAATPAKAATPAHAQKYAGGVDYEAEIQKAVAAGDLGAAAVLEQLRNAKIDAAGLGGQYAKSSTYAKYLEGVSPERQAQLRGGYSRESYLPSNPGDKISQLLTEWRTATAAQAENQIDYNTQKAINEAMRAQEDAQPEFQRQLNENEIDSAKAAANSALYAEARGDRGGIGQSQYNEVQAAALKNKQTIENARTKLATDTARQIADLRAQGDFQKADALLQISQQYLSKAMELEQWNANWGMSVEEMARQMEQWEADLELSKANLALQEANITGMYNGQPTRAAQEDERDRNASVGEALLKVGIMPSDAQLAAIGMSKDQAQAYIMALGLGFNTGGSSSGGGSSGGSGSGRSSAAAAAAPKTPETPAPAKAVNAALTYTQPKNSAPTPWQKPVKGYDL